MFTNSFVTIDEVVSDLMYRGQDLSMSKYDYWFHLCIQGIKKMNIFNLQTANIAYLQVPSTNIIDLPEDFVDYTKIGTIDANGVFHTLTLDPNIFPVPHEDCGEDTPTTLHADKAVNPIYLRFPGWYGAWIGTPYSLTGGYNVGYYNVDRANRKLYVSGLPVNTVIALEYKTTGVSINGVTLVRTQMQEALISWCMMTAQQFGVIKGSIDWTNKYYGDEHELESLDQAITMDEFLDILYAAKKQSPKG